MARIRHTNLKKPALKPSKKKTASSKRGQEIRMRRIAENVVSMNVQDQEVRFSNNQNMVSFPGTAAGAPPNAWTNNNVFDTSVVYTGITQGTGEGNRVGNRIKIKKFRFSFILNPSVNILTCHMVRMFVVTYKFDPNGSTASDIWAACQNWSTTGTVNRSFFDNGSATTGMLGNMQDLMLPVNTDAFTVHKVKTFKLGYSSLPTVAAGNAINGNNDFKYIIRGGVNLHKYMPKFIKYNDATTVHYNKKIFILFEVLSADGASNDDISAKASIWYNYNFVYENA